MLTFHLPFSCPRCVLTWDLDLPVGTLAYRAECACGFSHVFEGATIALLKIRAVEARLTRETRRVA